VKAETQLQTIQGCVIMATSLATFIHGNVWRPSQFREFWRIITFVSTSLCFV